MSEAREPLTEQFVSEQWLDGFPLACQVELAHTIEDAAFKAQRLADLSLFYIEAGQIDPALELLEQAVQAANQACNASAGGLGWSMPPWFAIVESYIMAGRTDLATEIVNKQISVFEGSSALEEFTLNHYLSSHQYDQASRLIVAMPDGREKDQALVRLCDQYAKAQQYDLARSCLERIQEESEKQRALSFVWYAYVNAGEFEAAIQTIESHYAYRDLLRKLDALGAVAAAYAKAGQPQKAMELFWHISDQTSQLKNTPNGLISIPSIAGITTSPYIAGLFKLAIRYAKAEFFDQAVQTAKRINNLALKAEVLKSIAGIAGTQGQYDRAAQIAYSIETIACRQDALYNLAQRCALAGRPDQALEIAEAIESAGWRNMALSDVSEAFLHNKQVEQALQIANRIDGISSKGNIISAIAWAFVRLGQEQTAFQIAEAPANAQFKAAILSGIAKAYAMTQQMDKGSELFNQIDDTAVRVRALRGMTQFFANRKDYQQGLLFLESIQPRCESEARLLRDQILLFTCVNRVIES